MLLSHTNPHLTPGALIARLVRDGLDRYDPARPRATGGRGSVNGARTVSKPARRDTETVQQSVVRAQGSDVERQSEVEQGDAPSAAVRDGVPGPSVPKRPSKPEHSSASPATAPNSGDHTTSAAKRHGEVEPGRTSRAAPSAGGGRPASAAKRHTGTHPGSVTSAAVWSSGGHTTSAAKRLAYAAAQGAVERSPALERHLAALNGFGALPGSRSRYIPVAVRREVWRRDNGCCSYVDPHSGRRCGSRYRLEIGHVVPFALGGATELWNLRIRCRAHHRLRHAPRHAHPASVPNEARRAPISAANPVEPGRTLKSHDASRRAGISM